jgi:DNA polymerase-3 subunit gamma/tau
MYQVIARKYRPQSFHDVVNQEHVKTTLENAIAQNRIAHGYIFSGQRGTGKTTVARILARCLNCVNGPTNQPCGVCANCLEVSGGGGMNVIEIDAASNRGINEMRELNQSVRQRPASARYKVFIIDEAHQITADAFNALLKTIEEPPEWVIFVLATTEAHKIPATIASRCQHFSFRSVDFEALIERMDWICRQEGIEAGAEALAVLAQAGEGSVRDSLSALDQAIACCGSKLDAAQVRSLLGGFSLESLYRVTEALTESNPGRMLAIVEDLERNGSNLQHFSREVARFFRNLLVAKVGDVKLIPASAQERERLTQIAAPFSEEDLTRYLQLSLDLFTDLQSSLQPRFHLELGLIRMVQAGRLVPIEQALADLGGPPTPPARTPVPPAAAPPTTNKQQATTAGVPTPVAARPTTNNQQPTTTAVPTTAAVPSSDAEWKERLHSTLMEIGKAFTADGLEHSTVTASATELQFTTPEEFMLGMKADDLNEAVRRIIGRPMKIKITTGQGVAPTAPVTVRKAPEDETSARALSNPEVKRFQEVFGGQIRTVRNLKE